MNYIFLTLMLISSHLGLLFAQDTTFIEKINIPNTIILPLDLNGLNDGYHRLYGQNGCFVQGYVVDQKREGVWSYNNIKLNLIEQCSFSKGKLNGKFLSYHSGVLRMSQNFYFNIRSGETVYYDENSNITGYEYFYVDSSNMVVLGIHEIAYKNYPKIERELYRRYENYPVLIEKFKDIHWHYLPIEPQNGFRGEVVMNDYYVDTSYYIELRSYPSLDGIGTVQESIFQNGNIRSIGLFYKNTKFGEWTYFDSCGVLIKKEFFKLGGILDHIEFYDTGNKLTKIEFYNYTDDYTNPFSAIIYKTEYYDSNLVLAKIDFFDNEGCWKSEIIFNIQNSLLKFSSW